MGDTRVALFDAYGTLLDVHSAMARHAGRLGPEWQRISQEWRAKQLEYTWVRSLSGAVDSAWPIEWTEEQRRSSIDRALLKRRCSAEDIAEVIVFLGVAAAMITAQTIVVDGGLAV